MKAFSSASTDAAEAARPLQKTAASPGPGVREEAVAAAEPARPPRPPWLRPGPIFGAAVIIGLIVLAILFRWNWLRGPISSAVSHRLHRPVQIVGDLHVHPFSLTPSATAADIVIGNPAWAGRSAMARIVEVRLQAGLKSLFFGPVDLKLVEFDDPRLALFGDASGRQNWSFQASANARKSAGPIIEHLVIRNGSTRFTDLKRRIAFSGRISSDEREYGAGKLVKGGTRISGALVVSGQPWAGPTPVVRAPNLLVEVSLLDLLHHHLVIPLVEADGAAIRLLRDAAGRENWSSGAAGKPLHIPAIRRLVIDDGTIRYDDVKRKLHFAGDLSTTQRIGPTGAGFFRLTGQGKLNTEPFFAAVAGGALVGIDKAKPWPFTAQMRAGPTSAQIQGRFEHPFNFGALRGRVHIKGPDLADFYPLTGLVLPTTPPYDLSSSFSRRGNFYALDHIVGRVGDSDLEGRLTVNHDRRPTFLSADLTSRRLVLADLVAAFGDAPRHAAGHTLSPTQKAISARLRARNKIFPDTPLGLDALPKMDAKVSYAAASVKAGHAPVRSLALELDLTGGVLALDPVRLGLANGVLAGKIRIDGRARPPASSLDLALANARLENFIGRGKPGLPIQGGLFARARLSGTGNSVAAFAASSSGAFSLVIPHGEIRQAFAELLGIDASKGLIMLLSKNKTPTPIRCGVADFVDHNGILQARDIVLDTGVLLAKGKGSIDLRNETLDLEISGKPKHFRLIRINAPITIKGPLDQPKFGVAIGKALPQVAASIALGVVAAPLAVIIPFVAPGVGHNADCAALTAEAGAPAPRGQR
ncbi:MAG: AsmA family protein [Caulobacteraceae bacterium]